MASQTTDPTAGPERIAFEVERLEQADGGRVEVEGRWFGVRGRRFMRPSLMVTVEGAQQRYLADLEQKPWAAEDGEQWLAVFPVEGKLGQASDVELSVAPDITVRLSDGGRPTTPRRRRPTAAILRAPRIRTDPDAPRPTLTERAQEIERLNARLITAGQALERERSARTAAAAQLEREHARLQDANEELERERDRRNAVTDELEQERAEALRLRAQVGKLRGELDLARAAQGDGAAAAAELDEVRRTLDEERSGAKRLRSQLAEARETAVRANEAAAAAGARAEGAARAQRATRTQSPPRADPTQKPPRAESTAEPVAAEDPDPTRRFVPLERNERTPRAGAGTQAHTTARGQAPPRPERPLNPSLRHRTYWLGRILVVLLMIAVIAAIILVIRSTGAL